MEGDELAVRDEQPHRRAVLDDQRRVAIVGADAEEVAVAEAGSSLDELVADVVAEAEGVQDVLPVAAPEDERLAVLLLPLEQARTCAPPGVEVDVLDTPDVVNRVHEHAAPEGLAVHVPNQVPFVAGSVNAVVGVKQFDLEHGGVLSAHGDRPRVGARLLRRVLVRVVDHDAFERAVAVQRDEVRPVLLPAVLGYEEGCAVGHRLGQSAIAKADMGRD